MDETAALDLDQRSIVVSLAASDEEGLTEAKNIYMLGREEETIHPLQYKLAASQHQLTHDFQALP